MNLLIHDYLRRYRWIYLAAAVLHLGALILSWQVKGVTVLFFFLGPSAFLLAYEISRAGGGIARTLMALPCTARQVSRTWRFVALTLPVIGSFLLLCLSVVISLAISKAAFLTFDRFCIIAVFQVILLGLSFFALSGVPLQQQGNRSVSRTIHDGFFGLIWGLSIPGAMFLMNSLPTKVSELHPAHILAGILMTAATIAGWFRADHLLLSRFQKSVAAVPAKQKSKGAPGLAREQLRRDIVRFGGIPFLMIRFGRNTGILGLAILLINWVGMRFFFGLQHQSTAKSDNFNPNTVMDAQLQFAVPFVALITAIILIGQLRSLRSLPLSRAALTNLLLLWPVAFTCLFGLAAVALYGLLFGGDIGWAELGYSASGSLIVLSLLPLVLRFGFRIPVIIAFFSLLTAVQVVRGFNQQFNFAESAPLALGVAAVGICIGWFFTYRVLATSHPWRAGALRLPGKVRRA